MCCYIWEHLHIKLNGNRNLVVLWYSRYFDSFKIDSKLQKIGVLGSESCVKCNRMHTVWYKDSKALRLTNFSSVAIHTLYIVLRSWKIAEKKFSPNSPSHRTRKLKEFELRHKQFRPNEFELHIYLKLTVPFILSLIPVNLYKFSYLVLSVMFGRYLQVFLDYISYYTFTARKVVTVDLKTTGICLIYRCHQK